MSSRTILEEMKARRKDAIEEITTAIRENQTRRRLVVAELRKRGPLTISELQVATGLDAGQILRHLIAMRMTGEVSELGEKDRGFLYALKRGSR